MLEIIQNVGRLHEYFAGLGEGSTLAVDTETSGTKVALGDRACGYSFAYRKPDGEVWSCYAPIRHDPIRTEGSLFTFDAKGWRNLNPADVNATVGPSLLNHKITKVLHHCKFDLGVFWAEGLDIRHFHDTMIMSNLIDMRRPNGLKKLMQIVLGETHTEQQELFRYMKYHGIKKNQGYNKLDIEVAGLYAARDTDGTLKLFERLHPELEAVRDIYDIERRIIRVLAKMESRGMPADQAYLTSMDERLRKAARNVERRAWKVAGHEFDLDSSQAIAKVLFGQFQLPIPKLTAGKGLTDKSVLERLEHPIARLVTAYRQISKLAGTYFGPVSAMVSPKGRIHASFQQVKQDREGLGGSDEGRIGTDTGRLACSEPNLTNVPTRRRVFKKGQPKTVNQSLVRRGFRIAEPGWDFLLFDFSQIELRVLAHASGDETLVEAYSKVPNDDIHVITARKIFPEFDNASEKERDLLRSRGKTLNFGIVYGMGPELLAVELGLIAKYGQREGLQRARDFLEVYFETYPGVRELDDELKREFKRTGYVETLYGRRRFMKPEEEYKALNTVVQGTAADMNKIALYQVEATLQGYASVLVNDIHDEVTIYHKMDEDVAPQIMQAMSDFPGIKVPIVVEASRAWPTWAQKKKLKLETCPTTKSI